MPDTTPMTTANPIDFTVFPPLRMIHTSIGGYDARLVLAAMDTVVIARTLVKTGKWSQVGQILDPGCPLLIAMATRYGIPNRTHSLADTLVGLFSATPTGRDIGLTGQTDNDPRLLAAADIRQTLNVLQDVLLAVMPTTPVPVKVAPGF